MRTMIKTSAFEEFYATLSDKVQKKWIMCQDYKKQIEIADKIIQSLSKK